MKYLLTFGNMLTLRMLALFLDISDNVQRGEL